MIGRRSDASQLGTELRSTSPLAGPSVDHGAIGSVGLEHGLVTRTAPPATGKYHKRLKKQIFQQWSTGLVISGDRARHAPSPRENAPSTFSGRRGVPSAFIGLANRQEGLLRVIRDRSSRSWFSFDVRLSPDSGGIAGISRPPLGARLPDHSNQIPHPARCERASANTRSSAMARRTMATRIAYAPAA